MATVLGFLKGMKNTSCHLFYFGIVFVFISNLVVTGLGYTSRYLWILFSVVFLLKFLQRNPLKINNYYFSFAILYSFFLVYISFLYAVSVYATWADGVTAYISFLLVLVSTVILVQHLVYKFGKNYLFLLLFLAILLHACGVLLVFISSSAMQFSLDYLPQGSSNIDHEISIRSKGFFNSAGATASIFLGFGTIVGMYLLKSYKLIVHKVFIALSILLILLSIVLVGRTGFVVFLVGAFIFTGGGILNSLTRVNKNSVYAFVVSAMIIFLALIFLKSYLETIKNSEMMTTHYGGNRIDAITGWLTKETSSETSTIMSLLSRHLIITESLEDLIFGNPDFYLINDRSDIGYLRKLADFGVFGSVLYYGSIFFLLFYYYRSTMNKEERLLMLSLVIVLLIVEAKEPFLYKLSIVSLYLFIGEVIRQGSTIRSRLLE